MCKMLVVLLLCLFVVGCAIQQDPATDGKLIGFDPNALGSLEAIVATWMPVASALANVWPGWGWALAIAAGGYATIKKLKITIPSKLDIKCQKTVQ